jgi:acyl dehydratase
MAEQLYFEDVQEGMEIPPLVHGPVGTEEIVRFSSAVENFEPLHHDYLWCKERGFQNILINGPLKQAFLASLMTGWIGEGGFLKKLACSHRGMDYPGNTLTAKGRVTRKYIENDLGYVECEIWIENQNGERTCPGSAIAILPQRGKEPIPLEYEPPKGSYEWAFEP